jgi:pimeloyl-ACP methyl ester carboxylesterase
LAAEGYRVATIDQRRGGDLFDGTNGVASRFDSDATSYCDAAPDLEAALDWAAAAAPGSGVVLWGSSYSAALVIRLAARRSDVVSGVLAFSPASGDPMDGCRPEEAAAELTVPWLVLRPGSEMEHPWIADQLEAFASLGAETYVARPGRHGSSMLVEGRVGASTDATWSVVLSFLERSGTPDNR